MYSIIRPAPVPSIIICNTFYSIIEFLSKQYVLGVYIVIVHFKLLYSVSGLRYLNVSMTSSRNKARTVFRNVVKREFRFRPKLVIANKFPAWIRDPLLTTHLRNNATIMFVHLAVTNRSFSYNNIPVRTANIFCFKLDTGTNSWRVSFASQILKYVI